jgi:hypothetical protein
MPKVSRRLLSNSILGLSVSPKGASASVRPKFSVVVVLVSAVAVPRILLRGRLPIAIKSTQFKGALMGGHGGQTLANGCVT